VIDGKVTSILASLSDDKGVIKSEKTFFQSEFFGYSLSKF
jgi:hypothetical protein